MNIGAATLNQEITAALRAAFALNSGLKLNQVRFNQVGQQVKTTGKKRFLQTSSTTES